MACQNLQQVFQLFQRKEITASRPELIRSVCGKCQRIDVCPAVGIENFDDSYFQTDAGFAMPLPTETR